MVKIKSDINSGLSWLERLLRLYRQYGTIEILKALILSVMCSLTLKICYDPDFLFDKYITYANQRHASDLASRLERDQKVKRLLPVYLYKYRASRVWIIQYHNGVMDWQHGTMRFEKCDRGVKSIIKQYNGFNLVWLDMPFYLKENETFIGTIDELRKVDPILYTQLSKNNVKYIACALIRDDEDCPIGIFGATWEEIPQNSDLKPDKIHDFLLNDRIDIKNLIQANFWKR